MFYTTNIKPQQTKQAQNILIKQIKTRDKNETQAGSLEHNRNNFFMVTITLYITLYIYIYPLTIPEQTFQSQC